MTDDEPTREELLAAVTEANDLLVEAIRHANRYATHEQLRASAVVGFNRVEEAHLRLGRVDPNRESPDDLRDLGEADFDE